MLAKNDTIFHGWVMIEFTAPLFRWSGGNWYFISLPEDAANEVRFEAAGMRGGFGSIKVIVRVGQSEWRTSLFPDSKRDTFLLPMKKAVRASEGLDEGDAVTVSLEIAY